MKEIERRAYLSYFEDGIIDRSIGFVILVFGIGMLMDTNLAFTFAAFIWVYWWSAKKLITIPRIGHVKFRRVRKKKSKRVMFFFLIPGTVSSVLMTGLWFAAAGKCISPEVLTFLRRFSLLPLANLADPLSMILPDVAILIYSVYMLISFLRKYPKPSEVPSS